MSILKTLRTLLGDGVFMKCYFSLLVKTKYKLVVDTLVNIRSGDGFINEFQYPCNP